MPFDEEKQLLVTLDKVSLYTNIPQIESMKTIEEVLNTCPQPSQVPTECIIELLNIALTENYFKIDKEYFQQCKGTSMGQFLLWP